MIFGLRRMPRREVALQPVVAGIRENRVAASATGVEATKRIAVIRRLAKAVAIGLRSGCRTGRRPGRE